jgi:hypothetical protein
MLGDQIKDKDSKVNLNKGLNDIIHSKQMTNAQAQDDTLQLILQKYSPLTHAFLFSSETLQCKFTLLSFFYLPCDNFRFENLEAILARMPASPKECPIVL